MNQPHNPTPAQSGAGASNEPTPYAIAKEQKSRMIRKMLYIGYNMGWDSARTRGEKVLTPAQRCWNHVEAWCRSEKCGIRKQLNRYTVEELVKVLSQFEEVYKSFQQQLKQQEK